MNRIMWMGAAALAALLAGCHDDNRAAAAAPDFTATVSAIVATPEAAAEVSAPVAVDAIVANSSETAEPVAVSF